jgi:hypothetical protein
MFDADEVAAWLETTGRGNNTEARNDVAAFARMPAPQCRAQGRPPAMLNGLTALLALKVITGQELGRSTRMNCWTPPMKRTRMTCSSIPSLKPWAAELSGLAGFADRLADSAFSAPAAFEKLLSLRFREGLREHSDTALTDPALDARGNGRHGTGRDTGRRATVCRFHPGRQRRDAPHRSAVRRVPALTLLTGTTTAARHALPAAA